MDTNTNLENKPGAKPTAEVDTFVDTSGVQVEDVDVDDLIEFDDEGNLVGKSTEDDEQDEGDPEQNNTDDIEQQDLVNTDELEQEPEPSQSPDQKSAKTPNQPTKAEIKVINLRKENQRLLREKQELESRLAEKSQKQEKDTLKAALVEKGYDEETAERRADEELRIRRIEERQAILDFREENEEVFAKYPQAKQEAKRILQSVTATGMTALQVCRGLYGESARPAHEERAIQAARGDANYSKNTAPNTAKTERSAGANSTVQLSAEDRRLKGWLERAVNNGKPMSNEEFMKYANK